MRWEQARPNPSLQALALAHGIPVWAAHRALTDCTYLAAVLERTPDLEQKLAEGLLPRRLVAADLPFARKDEAKAAGFRWQPERKQWIRRLTEAQIEALPFAVVALDP
jgi:DNA polymerase-3 subunit epsilon